MTGDLEPGPKPRGSKLLREFWTFAFIAIAVAVVFGGIQLWQIALAPHLSRVSVEAELDPIRASSSSAAWVLEFLSCEFTVAGEPTPTLILPPGTLKGELRVRGREARNAVQEGRVNLVLRVPGTEGGPFRIAPRLTRHDETSLTFTLSERQADEFQGRRVSTTVAVHDQDGSPVSRLRSEGELDLGEDPSQRGVYRVGAYVDRILLSVDAAVSELTLPVTDGEEPSLPNLRVPVEWLLHDGQESRILTLAASMRERRGEAEPEPAPVEPDPDPEPMAVTPPMQSQPEPPPPDPEELRRQELSRLRNQIDRALRRGDWDQAQGLVSDLRGVGAMSSNLTAWEAQIRDGRAQAQRDARLAGLASEIGGALTLRDWDAAESSVSEVQSMDPTEGRLAAWRQAIVDGRAEDRRLAEAATPPEPEPTPPARDDDALIRATLARYARSQNEHDMGLFLQVWPSVSNQRRQTVQRGWDGVRDTDYSMDIESIQVDGTTAVALIRQTVTIQPRVGGRTTGEARLRVDLSRTDDTWVIQDLTAR